MTVTGYSQARQKITSLLSKSVGSVQVIDWHYDGVDLLVHAVVGGKPVRAKISASGVKVVRGQGRINRKYSSLDDRSYFRDISSLLGDRSDSLDCSNSQPCGDSCISKARQCLMSLPLIGESRQLIRELFGRPQHLSPVTSAAKKSAEKHNSKIRNLSYERAAVVGPGGETVVSKKGGKDYVHFTPPEIQKMRNSIITHNHPVIKGCAGSPCANGFTFSAEDIGLAASSGAAEIQAVSPGYSHYLSPGPGGWDERKFSSAYLPTLQKERSKQIRMARFYVASGSKTVQEASIDAYHLAMLETAQKHRLDYKRVAVSKSARRDERRFSNRHGRSRPTVRTSRYRRVAS